MAMGLAVAMAVGMKATEPKAESPSAATKKVAKAARAVALSTKANKLLLESRGERAWDQALRDAADGCDEEVRVRSLTPYHAWGVLYILCTYEQ